MQSALKCGSHLFNPVEPAHHSKDAYSPNGGVRAARSPRGGLQRRIVDHAFGNRRPAYRPARRASSQCHRQRRRGSRLRKRRIFKRLDVVRQRCSIAFERASALRNVQRAERHNQEAGDQRYCRRVSDDCGAHRCNVNAMGVRGHQRHDQIRGSRRRRTQHQRYGAKESFQRGGDHRRLGAAYVQSQRVCRADGAALLRRQSQCVRERLRVSVRRRRLGDRFRRRDADAVARADAHAVAGADRPRAARRPRRTPATIRGSSPISRNSPAARSVPISS